MGGIGVRPVVRGDRLTRRIICRAVDDARRTAVDLAISSFDRGILLPARARVNESSTVERPRYREISGCESQIEKNYKKKK